MSAIVEQYINIGLGLGRHIDGLVDAYYGPPELAQRARDEPMRSPEQLVAQARSLIGDLDAGVPAVTKVDDRGVDSDKRRKWLRAQAIGLLTTARRLAGESISYEDEIELCYGVRPRAVPEDEIAQAHKRLDEALPGSGNLRDRFVQWREEHAVPPDVLDNAVMSLLEDLRERTDKLFGLPEGERVEIELVTNKPWAGFNLYLGDLRSLVSINTDLPVLSMSLGHLVAHEAYPGHHTEHTRKEIGLVRRRRYLEETIFMVGTPQCLLAEGLADLGLEVVVGERPEEMVSSHLKALGVRYDTEAIAAVSQASDALSGVRGNAALKIFVDGADPDVVIDDLSRWALLPRARAAKSVEFLMHPTWRAYGFCYIEGLRLCRQFVKGDPARFERLISEQLTPADLLDQAV